MKPEQLTVRQYLAAKFLAATIMARGDGVCSPLDMMNDALYWADKLLAATEPIRRAAPTTEE